MYIIKDGTIDDVFRIMEGINPNAYLIKALKKGSAKYYLVYNGEEFIQDYWIYDEGSVADLCVKENYSTSVLDNKEIMDMIESKIKKETEFKTISMTICEDKSDRIDKCLDNGYSINFKRSYKRLEKKIK